MVSRREAETDLAEDEQISLKGSGRNGITTHNSHIFWGFRSVGHAVHVFVLKTHSWSTVLTIFHIPSSCFLHCHSL
jgi:hypothetical protein